MGKRIVETTIGDAEETDLWLFRAFKNNEDYKQQKPFFEKVFDDHATMKVFSAKHSRKFIEKHPDYVSNYYHFTIMEYL